MAFIDAVLEADKQAPRKQRHTAHRIWCRIREEMPEVEVAESTIRRYVRERKVALAMLFRETFIPQSYVWEAHIIETGNESCRFRGTLKKKGGGERIHHKVGPNETIKRGQIKLTEPSMAKLHLPTMIFGSP